MKGDLKFSVLFFLLITGYLFSPCAKAQGSQADNGSHEQRLVSPTKASPGTYRFIIEPGGEQEAFTEEVLVIAEQLRMDHQRVTYDLSDRVSIEIFSRDELRDRQPSQIRSLNDNRANHEN